MFRKAFKTMPVFLLLFSSCSARNANVIKSYLNIKYSLVRVGDLHGMSPTSNEVLDRNPGFTSYAYLFDRSKSFINYQCKGTSYEDFHCEASFNLYDRNGNELIKVDSFICQYTGGQSGYIIFDDETVKDSLGTIYVYTPYWCRWQFEYDVDGSGNKLLLTFEFWRTSFNELPSFMNGNDNE